MNMLAIFMHVMLYCRIDKNIEFSTSKWYVGIRGITLMVISNKHSTPVVLTIKRCQDLSSNLCVSNLYTKLKKDKINKTVPIDVDVGT